MTQDMNIKDYCQMQDLVRTCAELRAEVEQLRAACDCHPNSICANNKKLRAEVERLTASLKMTNGGERELSAFLKQEAEVERLRVLAEDALSVGLDPLLDNDEKVDQMVSCARRALEPKP